tara:strand:+ start:1440 stop:2237 length:798 start_codon:yes stop_codon:yes gene_type:complete
MPFNKIQPEQIQLATFFSSSGDIAISQTDTGIGLNLSRDIVGDFAISGDSSNPLVINKRGVFTMPLTGVNTVANFSSGTFVFNGADNVVSGTRNIVINGDNNSFSGNSADNVSVNGLNQDFGSGVEGCTALAGDGATFPNAIVGSTVITDGLSATASPLSSHSLMVDFASGAFFDGGETRFLSSYYVKNTASGIHSGDLSVLGDTFLSGTFISGVTVFNTGYTLPQWVGADMVGTSGSMAVSGGNLIVHLEDSWYGLGTAAMTPL